MKPVYVIASNLLGQRTRMDMIADNIANVNTSGYKHQKMDFQEIVSRKQATDVASFTHHSGTTTNFANGSLTKTNNQLDMAIQGEGFFAVNVGGNVRYTKNGAFTQDIEGNLVTTNGDLVLDVNNAPINIPPGSTEVIVTENGTISDQNGIITTLGLFRFNNPQSLTRAGNNAWIATEEPQLALDVKVSQGFVEGSNVNAIEETVNMTEVLRQYQGAMNLVQKIEELEQRAIRDLSRLP